MKPAPPFGLADGGQRQRPATGRISPRDHLHRACVAAYLSAAGQGASQFPAEVARRLWPDDIVTPLVLQRSLSAPATTADAVWAAPLAAAAVGEFYSTLPASAASRLIAAGAKVPMAGVAEIAFPRSVAPPDGDLAWVGEGLPVQVRQFALTAASLEPRKFGVIVALSGELAAHTAAEVVVTQMLREEAALTLDAVLFSTAAASALRPAGLLAGVTPLTATAGGGTAAMEADLAALIGSVAAAGGAPETTVIVAAPAQAAAIMVRSPLFKFAVWSTRALAAGTVVAIDTAAFASGFGTTPEITASRDAAVPFEDSVPLAIASGAQGSGVLATPVRSFYQQDLIGLKLIARAAFVMRAPGLVAFVTATTW